MDNQYPSIFSQGRIGQMELKNRIVMPAMATGYTSEDGTVSEKWLRYLEARARGGVGLIIIEVTAISPEGRGFTNQLGIYEDRFIPGFKELAKRMHAHGTKVAVQLHHAGRRTTPGRNGGLPIVAPSPIPDPVLQVKPRELTEKEILNLVEAFTEGACRVREAGLDAVEIHGAHGYLIGQFMSLSANRREDAYGHNLQGRLQFPVEIITRVRKKVGQDFPILFRTPAEEGIRDGLTLEESQKIALAVQGAGIDALNVSVGIYSRPGSPAVAPMDLDPGFLIPRAEAIKSILKIPVIGVGRINHPELAERILADGRVDFLAVGRAHLADPDFLAKARSGKSDQIRKCIACNQGCIDRLFGDKMITCLVNPECGREVDFPPRPVDRKKRVVIVGGGPAGLQAARIMALRKHEVTLLEKENFLGGQFLAAAVTPKKEDFREAIDFLAKEVREAGVNVKLSTEADERLVKKLNPEVVIVATGSSPVIPKIKGLQNLPVFTAQDVLLGKKEIVVQKILIIGGGMVGVEVADFLGQRGKQVIVVEMTGQLAAGMGAGHWFYVQERLEKYGVEILTNAVVEEVSKKAIVLRLGKEKRTVEGIETIILASGVRPQNEMADKLKGIVAEIHVIGDAREPRNALDAVLEGVEVGEKV